MLRIVHRGLKVDSGVMSNEVDCFMFASRKVNFILGVSWLATLGKVKVDLSRLSMKISSL